MFTSRQFENHLLPVYNVSGNPDAFYRESPAAV
jgi:hypothetical protein